MAHRRLRGRSRGLRWGQVGGRELASPAAVAGPPAPGGGEEAGAAACSGNVPGGRPCRADGPGRGARGPPAGVARFGVPVRARGGRSTSWAGLGPRATSRPPRRGVGGRAWRSLGRRDWAGAAVSQWQAPPTPRRALQQSASGPSAGFAPEAPDLGRCNLLRRRGPREPGGVAEGSPAFPGYQPVSPESYFI